MKKRINLSLENPDQTAEVCKALSASTRISLLHMLVGKVLNVSEIAQQLDIPISSAAYHVNLLQDAGLIQCSETPGVRGSQKLCGLGFDDLYLSLPDPQVPEGYDRMSYSIPVGTYFNCDVTAPCGLANNEEFIGFEDHVNSFYQPDRINAQLLWFTTGFVEYRTPVALSLEHELHKLSLSFELCSEAVGFNPNWPSDIDLLINDRHCCTIQSEGDYGDKRGTLNPAWWSTVRTQYGKLYVIEIDAQGTWLNSKKVSAVSLDELQIKEPYLSLIFQVRKDAKYPGGLNLFGEGFGEHPQAINLDLYVANI